MNRRPGDELKVAACSPTLAVTCFPGFLMWIFALNPLQPNFGGASFAGSIVRDRRDLYQNAQNRRVLGTPVIAEIGKPKTASH